MPIQARPTRSGWTASSSPWDEAQVHVLTHTLHYGSGVFEGIRAYATTNGPAVFRLTDHIERLLDSAELFLMEMPYSVDELVEASSETVRVNELESCYIRPIAFLGYGEMGLNPLPCEVKVSIACGRGARTSVTRACATACA